MATPINSPLTREIWHLSIDDLLAPTAETPRLGGEGPFVINLSASTAPISVPIAGVAGSQAHVYQLQRPEDGRMRYRLRLGPFTKEEDADAVLLKVREVYPSALTATAGPDDLRAIAALQAKAAPPTLNERSAAQSPPPPKAGPAATAPAAAMTPAAAAPPAMAAGPPIATASAAAMNPPVRTAAPAAPYRSPRIPVLLTEVVSRSAAASPPKAVPSPTRVQVPPTTIAGAKNPPPLRELRPTAQPAPTLDSTQTLRALTTLELEDEDAMRWFVIQLALVEDAIDPDTVPNLDIFSVYRLYAVAGLDQGRIMHALRLGFFSEELAAAAVASYLSAYYEKPSIKRVSAAERDRFADQRVEARKDIGATGRHAVIEITNERVVRNTISVVKSEPQPGALLGLRTAFQK
jgi:hypothetical protein